MKKTSWFVVFLAMLSVLTLKSALVHASDQGAIILIYGEITENTIANSIEELFKTSPEGEVSILINSGGGGMDEAISFYALSKETTDLPKINTFGVGVVGSAAVVLFCIGEERLMTENSYIVLHPMTTVVEGVSENVRSQIYQKVRGSYSKIISQCSGGNLTSEKVEQMMDHSTFISAEKALELGLDK